MAERRWVVVLILALLVTGCAPGVFEVSGDEEVDYTAALHIAFGEYSRACEEVQAIEFADRERDDQWLREVKRAIDGAKAWSGAIRRMRPPARYWRLHGIYERALAHYDRCLDLTYRGYKDGDEDLLWQSIEELRLGNEIMDETDAAWEELD